MNSAMVSSPQDTDSLDPGEGHGARLPATSIRAAQAALPMTEISSFP